MADADRNLDPYDLVLNDLRAQRRRIDAAIEAIEGVRGITARVTAPSETAETPNTPAPRPPAIVHNVFHPPINRFSGLTIYEAAKQALRDVGKPLTNIEITEIIQVGGLKLNAVDPYNTVGSVLTRRFYEHGDVVRVGRGTWGLPEWTPEHDFRAEAIKRREARASDSEEETNSTSITERGRRLEFDDM